MCENVHILTLSGNAEKITASQTIQASSATFNVHLVTIEDVGLQHVAE